MSLSRSLDDLPGLLTECGDLRLGAADLIVDGAYVCALPASAIRYRKKYARIDRDGSGCYDLGPDPSFRQRMSNGTDPLFIP